jgi:hypothetical protein
VQLRLCALDIQVGASNRAAIQLFCSIVHHSVHSLHQTLLRTGNTRRISCAPTWEPSEPAPFPFGAAAGVRHTAEVTAESLYKAAVLGIRAISEQWAGAKDWPPPPCKSGPFLAGTLCPRRMPDFRYALNQRDALTRFLQDGELEIDNGATERADRDIALGGRGNWTFFGSDAGGTDGGGAALRIKTMSRFVPENRLPAERLDVTVVYTEAGWTNDVLRRVAQLAANLRARVRLIVPRVVPHPLPLDEPR